MTGLRVLGLLCALLLPASAWSAVTFDQAWSGNTGANLMASIAYSATVAAGPNRVLLVSLCTANGVANDVATATFDEEPLTFLGRINTSAGNVTNLYLYVLVNPPAVTGTVEFVLVAANTKRMVSGAIALQGVHQTTPYDTPVMDENASAATILSVAVATVTDELVVDALCHRDTAPTLTMDAASGRTQRYINATSHSTLSGNVRMAGSTRTGTGTLPMGWTLSAVDSMAEIGLNVNVAPAAPPTGGALSLGIRMLQ